MPTVKKICYTDALRKSMASTAKDPFCAHLGQEDIRIKVLFHIDSAVDADHFFYIK